MPFDMGGRLPAICDQLSPPSSLHQTSPEAVAAKTENDSPQSSKLIASTADCIRSGSPFRRCSHVLPPSVLRDMRVPAK